MKLILMMLLAISGLAICGCEDEQNTTVNEAPDVTYTNHVEDGHDVVVNVPGTNNTVDIDLSGTNSSPTDVTITVPGDDNAITVRAAHEFDCQRRAIEELGI